LKKLALLSVSDKTSIVELAAALEKLNYKIIATGNTSRILKEANIDVTEISSITGFAEILEGRVKTLHPKIFGGILLRRDNDADIKEAEENAIEPIDVVCVNLYPFIKTAENPESTLNDIIENIDIGGPSLIRAAAKNHKFVSVLTNHEQYSYFIGGLKTGEVSLSTRRKLAVEAFSHTSHYDTYIANFFEEKFQLPQSSIRINLPKEKVLRYGENPHQKAAIYGNFESYFEFFHGKELSYNNILDLTAAVELIEELGKNSCAIIKHSNPAGAAVGKSSFDAYSKALKCDPVSAFGGIVAFASAVDAALAEKLNEIFLEIICAPDFTEDALNILKKKKDRRLLKQLKQISSEKLSFRNIPGGIIAQDYDKTILDHDALKFITNKKPSETELEDLIFAWKVAKYTKSNAIVFAKEKATLGVGAGQMSRIDSVKIAAMKAEEHGLDLKGSAAASDAFFPFADGLIKIIECGAQAVIQPGGSVRDAEVIEAADKFNISMIFTGIRHFKH
jgi:phosphoribosylaminoimidazolecarboxamide formyltransferase/IMP cyclohydrolase